MKYRVKSGKIHPKINGKRVMVKANDIVDWPPELATKFKDQLQPLGDAYFVDKDHMRPDAPREHLKIVEARDGEGFNVINTISGKSLNDEPLSLQEAELMTSGANIQVAHTFGEGDVIGDPPDKKEKRQKAQKALLEEEISLIGKKKKPKASANTIIGEDEGKEEAIDEDEAAVEEGEKPAIEVLTKDKGDKSSKSKASKIVEGERSVPPRRRAILK
ncbi:MAG: hypothetical protein KKD77_23975 [Gammaproteobacteria bacterium]|nr:hypothetical protein [Gammaproteobacteria bacterium]